jgi:unsaturated chondroitin disaccharide hydrolase
MKANSALASERKSPGGGKTSMDQGELKKAFELCIGKTRNNIKKLADHPTTWAWDPNGNYSEWKESFFDIGNWTTSFFTGMALLSWQQTEDEYFPQQVQRLAPLYRMKVHEYGDDTMHDLGFLYSLYSIALHKLTDDKEHRAVGLRAAELLAGRFVPNGNYIRAWGRMDELSSDYAGLAIIDCMMNLPLLYWASNETADARFREIAIRHANMTLTHFVRPDDSVFHAYRFKPKTGEAIGGDNYCGQGVSTHWARGTAWAIYGFALSYAHTRDLKYLDASVRIARKFIENLDDEIIPLWDFKSPAGEPQVRDSSAAAVAVCGFQELEKHQAADAAIIDAKQALLGRLCSDHYLDGDEVRSGLLRHGQVGYGVEAYTSWGDYYLMEALARELGANPGFW